MKPPSEVFPAVGKPTITYVERDAGLNERKLKGGILNPGQICLVTGPSKTGKTSLYRTVLPTIKKDELIVRCSGDLTAPEFWACALESLDFSRLADRSREWKLGIDAEIGVEGEIGVSWLAKALAKFGVKLGGEASTCSRQEYVQAGLSAKHLIPILKALPVQLVVEDFHYLSTKVKREVFQQWKGFTDEGVSVIVVSITHHAIDIAKSNSDLTGRTRFIEVGQWSEADLAEIPKRGFEYYKLKHSAVAQSLIAKESVGLPIVAQQICQDIMSNRELSPGTSDRHRAITVDETRAAQRRVADELYANHKGDYDRLSTGPRKAARKHPTYERILGSFALEPLKFSLKHHELMERIAKLTPEDSSPVPSASVGSSLRALASFQTRNKLSLLEWHEQDQELYILEPTFLFYLRQKLALQSGATTLQAKLTEFIERMFKSNEGRPSGDLFSLSYPSIRKL